MNTTMYQKVYIYWYKGCSKPAPEDTRARCGSDKLRSRPYSRRRGRWNRHKDLLPRLRTSWPRVRRRTSWGNADQENYEETKKKTAHTPFECICQKLHHPGSTLFYVQTAGGERLRLVVPWFRREHPCGKKKGLEKSVLPNACCPKV